MEMQSLEVAILTESFRSKAFLFFSSLGMPAVTSRFDLLPPKGQLIFMTSCGTTLLQSAPELEI